MLDTTFLIVADRSGSVLDDIIDDEDDVAIAAVTVAELLVGVELSDGEHRPARQRFVDDISTTIPIVSYDATVASSHAQLLVATRRQGRQRGAHDLIIAATARATQREVLSADLSTFEDLPGVICRPQAIVRYERPT
ncbi:MAG TPA: PIN domain-containing protein [Acidimicrobiales bacterium]|nr:PIN domain-containing protein [Acidimicrobiales bacterium]